MQSRNFSLFLLLSVITAFRISDYNSSFVGAPDIFIIGAHKAGTTFLSGLLVNYLKLCVQSNGVNEPHFFDQNFNDDGFIRYIDGFKNDDKITLDATSSYFRTPIVWDRLKKLYSSDCLRQKKFILILRAPIVRELSWLSHYFRECKKHDAPFCSFPGGSSFNDTFHDYVKRTFQDVEELSGDGFYIQNIQNLLKVVSRNQVFILNFESLFGDKQTDTINRLLYFIGKSPVYSTKELLPYESSRLSQCEGDCDAFSFQVLCSDLKFLHETYSKANEGLIDFINFQPFRPISEPHFLPFTEKISRNCTEDYTPRK